jgi:hypothetical protein
MGGEKKQSYRRATHEQFSGVISQKVLLRDRDGRLAEPASVTRRLKL